MRDWNVVARVGDRAYQEAHRAVGELAPVAWTDYFNGLVMRVPEVRAFAEDLLVLWEADPNLSRVLGRVTPLERLFHFQSPAELEARAKGAVTPWLETLAGTRFYVRMHRRGFKARIASPEVERLLDRWIQERVAEGGPSAEVDFADPDWIVDLETVAQRGWVACWGRIERARYPFLNLD
ncbi:THUMP domain-containing protein [Thiohalorhabdus sp.]|uniref:THUMP domain-containing protein n=1 Tax=Thiohalorhabdus sp. TaxID=3094134 RepID=UPI002FC2E38B